MKKLLLIPLLLLAFIVKAQLPVTRGPDGVTVEDYRLYILKNFRLPVFHDTAEANVSKGLDSVGTLIAIRGTDTVYIRKTSTGTIHKWSQLVGSGGGGGVTDTIFVTPIGTAAGMIQTLYAVDGNLRVSNWGPGYGTLPFLAGDSLAYIDIDTTSIAYKSWVIAQFGTSINNLQQVIDNGNRLNRNDTIMGDGVHDLYIDSVNNVLINNSGHGGYTHIWGGNNNALIGVEGPQGIEILVQNITPWINTRKDFLSDSIVERMYYFFPGSEHVTGYKTTIDSMTLYASNGTDSTNISLTNTDIRLKGVRQANDTTIYKPLGLDNTGKLRRMDGWAGGGGGGSSNGIGRDTVQTYTSGTTLTQSASTNYIQVNPASVQAALTITTLASGGTWHTSNDLYIVFGGTVTSGNPVITSFTFTAGSGLTVVDAAAPSAILANAGDVFHYHKIGTILYRIP